MVGTTYKVLAHWDGEASVWWAESTDIKGLVAEADTLDQLIADLRELVPELLTLNQPHEQPEGEPELAILADRIESIRFVR